MKALAIGVGCAILLSGCALGIQSGDDSPTVTYTVPRSYQLVYLRVQNQADLCLRGGGDYEIFAQVDPALHVGVVSVRSPFSETEVARTEIKALDARHTEVKHTVWGRDPWGQSALGAMHRSVLLDTSVCVAYK